MNILVTGGSGFIGNHLLRALVQTNHNIACISRQKLVDFDSIQLILGDLVLTAKMRQEIIEFEPDVIIYLSWQGIPDYSETVSKLCLPWLIRLPFFLLRTSIPRAHRR